MARRAQSRREVTAACPRSSVLVSSPARKKNYGHARYAVGGHRKLDIRTNADTPEQTENAIAFGATGIGLTRTEHMFFEGNRIDAMREMILAAIPTTEESPRLLPQLADDLSAFFARWMGFAPSAVDPPSRVRRTIMRANALSAKLGISDEISKRVHEPTSSTHVSIAAAGSVTPSGNLEMQARAILRPLR
jgi:pyruvate,orthophosphate dikinase